MPTCQIESCTNESARTLGKSRITEALKKEKLELNRFSLNREREFTNNFMNPQKLLVHINNELGQNRDFKESPIVDFFQ